MASICLNMIVKDEAAVIQRCLASVKPWIDAWVIVDTGSTDGTQALVREALGDLPGELVERPWVDFAANRTEAIALARDRAEYLLFIDADEVLVAPPGHLRPDLAEDAYLVEYRFGNLVYGRPSLVATRVDWAFEGVLHEFLVRRDRREGWWATARWEGPFIQVFPEGARSRDPEKYRKDAGILERALAREPENARYAFYLAQSLRDAGDLERSLEAYRRRAGMTGSLEETWHALYQIARILERLERPASEVIEAYERAYAARPQRIEPLGCLARYLRLRGDYAQAMAVAARGLAQPPTTDILFVEREYEQWMCRDEFAVSAYWAGCHRESLEACDGLLAEGFLPPGERERVERNRAFALAALAPAPEPARAAGPRLNLAWGGPILPGWLNLAGAAQPGVDLVVDLEGCEPGRIPLPDDSVEEILADHLLQRIHGILPLMEELHRVARPGARLTIRVPHGASDEAWSDPGHQRPWFPDTFGWFGQPRHGRPDRGYRGDWDQERLELRLADPALRGQSREVLDRAVREGRNGVREMVATLRAVKPIRAARAEPGPVPPAVYGF